MQPAIPRSTALPCGVDLQVLREVEPPEHGGTVDGDAREELLAVQQHRVALGTRGRELTHHGELVVRASHHVRATGTGPEARLFGEREPVPAALAGVAEGATGLRGDARVAEVLDRRSHDRVSVIDDDDPVPAAVGVVSVGRAHDPGTDDDDVEASVVRHDENYEPHHRTCQY
ncbi:hypothetical protein MTP03_00080 [Tsukamurella sp. PLM1]|nr:hypothetical protein MTP03_00080 [Tsukamurella sp. PLM1]